MALNRRDFIKTLGTVGAGGVLAGLPGQSAQASGVHAVSPDWMGVLVDLTKCNGCRRCEAACQQAANFAVPTPAQLDDRSIFQQHRRPGPRSYTTVNEFKAPGANGASQPVYVKANCLHCNDPGCVSACLVGAFRKQPNGAVTYDAWKCMGCRYCMVACPFQIPTYEYDNVFTPQVRKCTLCADEGNPNKGGVPACVQACPQECLTWGKRSELLARAHEKIKQHPDVYVNHVYGEHEVGGTSWLYLSGVPFEQLGFLSLPPDAAPRLTEGIQHGVFKYFVPPIAWCGLLGMAMWLTRPEAGSEPHGQAHAEEPQGTGTHRPAPSGDTRQPKKGVPV